MKSYFTETAGNTLTRWMNLFAKAYDAGRYERIEYKIWRQMKTLSECNKIIVSVELEANEKHLKTVSIQDSNGVADSITFTTLNPFVKFMEGVIITGTEDNASYNWHTIMSSYAKDYINPLTISNNTISTSKYTIYDTGCATDSYTNYTTVSGFDSLKSSIQDITDELNKLKETTTMATTTPNTNNIFNFDFGPVSGPDIRMSMYGYAIPNEAGKYVSYDPKSERMMDVQILNFDCAGLFYKMPKPLSRIEEGNIIFHNDVPVFVTGIIDENRIYVVDPKDGTEKVILPSHSPFGFDYVTCLVSLINGLSSVADEDNPFGNMLPLIMLGNSKSQDISLPLLMMMTGNVEFDNPMMLLALSGGKFDTSNPLMLMALMKGFDK